MNPKQINLDELQECQKQLGVLQNRIDRALFFLNQDLFPNYEENLEAIINILLGKDD